ncbi:MAG: hypothetical protein M3Q60_04850 [Actinomycetota bacterium]|nr:hypothetical protein [Actinomycetota bacterium]
MPWLYAALFALLAGGVGLLVATLVPRLARPALQSGFSLRYAAMAPCVFIVGALTGVRMDITNLVFFVDSSAGNSAISLLYVLPYLFGGLLGLLEGLISAVPLAALLGLFRPRV